MKIHTVEEGESVRSIAAKHGISPTMLADINGCEVKEHLCQGEELLILTPTRTVSVKRNDDLDRIAERFSRDKEYIMSYNPILGGREDIYEGLTLGVRYQEPLFGTIITNGYYYRGCKKDRLISVLPYLSFITVCAYKLHNGEPVSLIDPAEPVSDLGGRNIPLLLRIYLGRSLTRDMLKHSVMSVAKKAKKAGYCGIVLSSVHLTSPYEGNAHQLIEELKSELKNMDLALLAESCADDSACGNNVSLISYDKLHLNEIPTFKDGEERIFEQIAARHDPSRILVEMSPFAFKKDKFIGKDDALTFVRKRRIALTADEERGILAAQVPEKDKPSLIMESLKNVKAKLELISRLGFMGVSFDIARTPIKELLLLRSMFGIARIGDLIF